MLASIIMLFLLLFACTAAVGGAFLWLAFVRGGARLGTFGRRRPF
jgi:hypothetical protein